MKSAFNDAGRSITTIPYLEYQGLTQRRSFLLSNWLLLIAVTFPTNAEADREELRFNLVLCTLSSLRAFMS